MSSRNQKREQKRNSGPDANTQSTRQSPLERRFMEICDIVQEKEECHQRCITELISIHRKMPHDEFMLIYLKAVRKWMSVSDFENGYARLGLKFMARLTVSSGLNSQENQMMNSIAERLLDYTSHRVTIRLFIHYFIQFLVKYASVLRSAIDFDGFVKYAMDSMEDVNGTVREQAAMILLHFQDEEDVMETLLYHLNCDPCGKTRRTIVKTIRFTDETVPKVLERLLDVNEDVRCKLYFELVERDVRTLTIAQRLKILDFGYYDQSAKVQAVITNRLITSWLQLYDGSYVALLSAIKYDANEDDIKNFLRVAQYILFNSFERLVAQQEMEIITQRLKLETDGNFVNCLPFHWMTLESLAFWLIYVQFANRQANNEQNQPDYLICDLDPMCKYIQTFINYLRSGALVTEADTQYQIQILIQILLELDVDEFGRDSIKGLVSDVLWNETENLNEVTISGLVKCAAKTLHPPEFGAYYYEIIQGICDAIPSIDEKLNELIEKVDGVDQNLRITQLKSHILELKEEESNLINVSVSNQALHQIRAEIRAALQQIIDICVEFGKYDTTDPAINLNDYEMSMNETIKILQIFFYVCHSVPKRARVPPEMVLFYKNFIHHRLRDANIEIRGWSLKCAGSFAMQFEEMAFDALTMSYEQLLVNDNPQLWSIAVTMICEILDLHRIEFNVPSVQDDTKDATNTESIIDVLLRLVGDVREQTIKNALVTGLCRLILSDYIRDERQIAVVFIEYFDPNALPSTQQIKGIFFGKLHHLKRQSCLVSALIPTLDLIAAAPYEQEYFKIKLKDIISFVISITEPTPPNAYSQLHTQIAIILIKILLERRDFDGMQDWITGLFKTLNIEIYDGLKYEIRKPLAELLDELSGDSKKNANWLWKKIGLTNSDRTIARRPSQSPEVELPGGISSRYALRRSTRLTRQSSAFQHS